MPRSTKAAVDPDDAPLKRLGGGRWQTRDERFSIEPQSGTWAVVDSEQTDDLGMPLVRGPFPSLTAAKEAIAAARSSEPAASPLAARIERRQARPKPKPDAAPGREPEREPKRGRPAPKGRADERGADERGATDAPRPESARSPRRSTQAPPKEEPAEPGWISDLDAAERGRARRLIARLTDQGVADAEGLVRRDIVGDVAAIAAHAVSSRLAQLRNEPDADDVANLLAEGRDDELGVRWRLVDGAGRPIVLGRRTRRR
jgi:hypothetical protein